MAVTVRMIHFSGTTLAETALVKDVPPDPVEYLALIGESYDREIARSWHPEDLQRTLLRVQLRYGTDGAVMYVLCQDLMANPEGRSTGSADYLFSRFRGWRPMIFGDVLVCGHDGIDTDAPTWCMPLEKGSLCACGRRARGWRCDEGGEWGLACSLHFGAFGDCGQCDDMVPDFKDEPCNTCKRTPVGGHFVYPGRAEAWDRHKCLTCGPIGSVSEVEDHCTENGLCSRCWGHGWIHDSGGTPCHACGGPGTITAQRSFGREELNDWRRRFPEADAILHDLRSQGLGWREVGEPAGVAECVYVHGQPPGDEAAQLVVDHHARGWPDRRDYEDEEPEADTMLPADGQGWPWQARSRVCCAAIIIEIRPVRRTRLRTVYFLSRDGRRLKWVSSSNHDETYLQQFTPGDVGELNAWVKAIETDDDGPIAVIWTGRSAMTWWNPYPRDWRPTQSLFDSLHSAAKTAGPDHG